MDATRIVELLKQETEMDPDLHDGSYELMRKIVESYSKIEDFSVLNFKDLNAVYAMAIGTWKLNVEKKKEYVNSGHLSDQEKEKMTVVIDDIWDRACRRLYANCEGKGPSIGMFGTGFYSFERNADDLSCQRFIRLLIDIADIAEDEQIFNLCDQVFDSKFTGMQAAAASVMLHCLKPYVFPVLNTNFGDGTVYPKLEIELEKPDKLSTYISNCRKIKKFRDENLVIKNYRILDLFPRKYKLYDDEFFPAIDEYDPGLTAEDYHDLFLDESVVKRTWLEGLYELYLMPDHLGTCKQLGNKYGYAPAHYISYLTTAAERIALKTNCPLLPRSEENARYWPVLFVGKQVSDSSQGTYCWKMREPVVIAIETLIDEGKFDYMEGKKMVIPAIDVNTILYGPPGTGKTFNTIIYAVSIVS